MNTPTSQPVQVSSTLIPILDQQLNLEPLKTLLATINPKIIACSGGIDSLLLSTIAHRESPNNTIIAHAVSPAVPEAATARVKQWAAQEGWNLNIVSSGEFQSEDYLNNPVNRCYYCKSNLYESLDQLSTLQSNDATLLSGANLDDLGEYRPGLIAASEKSVRHPLVEANIDKAMIRAIARHLQLPFADLPASPCLASRLYTGTKVTPSRLKAIEVGEIMLREALNIDVVRCRIKDQEMIVEVSEADGELITPTLLKKLFDSVISHEPNIKRTLLDAQPYRAGRAFLVEP